MRTRGSLAAVLAAAFVTSLAVASPSQAGPSTIGAPSAGDPFFPWQGNGGYDVAHYGIAIDYTPATRALAGVTSVAARATQRLTRFDLDLRRNLHVSAVTVDGQPAAFAQPAAEVQELVITPAAPLRNGQRFDVVVHYAGTALPVIDPDGSLDGFIPTADGAFVAAEPQGAPSWFPANDTPRDKATADVTVTVPDGLTAVSNGRLVSVTRGSQTVTWSWALAEPVSTYLLTATIGRFETRTGTTPGGVPYFEAVDPASARAWPVLAKLPAIVDYFSSVYGPYPFDSTGAIVDHATKVGYALETATRPLFDRAPDIATLSHELAHQWYGDTVTLARWRDIWLNEGFAEFSSWLWDEHSGGKSAAAHLRKLLSHPASTHDTLWNPPPGNPGSAVGIFSWSVYERGAGTLEALREKLGDATFFTIMRGWLAAHRYGNATVPEFTQYAASVAHQDLSHFFYVWLYRPGKPSNW